MDEQVKNVFVTLRHGKGARAHIIYADLYEAESGCLLIAADMDYVMEAIKRRGYTLVRRPVLELRLCESQRLTLKPNVLYHFSVDENCSACKKVEADGKL